MFSFFMKKNDISLSEMEGDVTQSGEVVLNAGYYSVREKERTDDYTDHSRSDLCLDR